jgi:homoserine dehydrogenase
MPSPNTFFYAVDFIYDCRAAKLAFGKTIPVASVHTSGISKITSVDFEYAKILKSTIKLLGTATLSETTGADGSVRKSLAVFVSPTVVSLSSALAGAKGPGNIVSPSHCHRKYLNVRS